jgi:hypothetical protein
MQDLYTKLIKCCLNNDDHIVYEPIMVKCGGNACKKCVNDATMSNLKCFYCNENHLKAEMLKMPPNQMIQKIIENKYLKDLVQTLKLKLIETAKELEGMK